MNKMKLYILTMIIVFFFTACPNMDDATELPWHFVPGLIDKDYQVKTAIAINGNGDPRVALNYRMGSSAGAYYFDYVVLCSAKMRVNINASGVPVFSLDTGDLDGILFNSTTYLGPLRLRGIKIVLEVINGGDGFTFANLPYALRQQFAKTCRDTIVRYGLHGLSFKDINGDDPDNNFFAYPDGANPNQPQYYDAYFDDFSEFWSGINDTSIGSRITINNVRIPKNQNDLTDTDITNQLTTIVGETKIDYFWHTGGFHYGNFLSYFRELDAWQTSDSNIAVIGKVQDPGAPLWVWETGFAGGHLSDHTNTELMEIHVVGGELQYQKSYLTNYINDPINRPGLTFTGMTSSVVNIIISPNMAGEEFGWNDSGVGVLETSPENYCPGILDLGSAAGLSNSEIEIFSRRFAQGKDEILEDGDPYPFWGNPFGLLYYTNVGPNDAAKISITSRIVYGGRDEDENGIFMRLREDGPAVISTGQYSAH